MHVGPPHTVILIFLKEGKTKASTETITILSNGTDTVEVSVVVSYKTRHSL